MALFQNTIALPQAFFALFQDTNRLNGSGRRAVAHGCATLAPGLVPGHVPPVLAGPAHRVVVAEQTNRAPLLQEPVRRELTGTVVMGARRHDMARQRRETVGRAMQCQLQVRARHAPSVRSRRARARRVSMAPRVSPSRDGKRLELAISGGQGCALSSLASWWLPVCWPRRSCRCERSG